MKFVYTRFFNAMPRFALLACAFFLTGCASVGKDTKSTANCESPKMVRLAKIDVHSQYIDAYKAFLKEEISESLKREPGVLMLYALYDKNFPNKITILEIYKDEESYKKHISSPHFLKYKKGVENMVKSLQLSDMSAILPMEITCKP